MPHPAIIMCMALVTAAAWGANPPAQEVVNWDFEDASLEGWRCKDNCDMSVAEDPERGNILEGGISYAEFNFGWCTRFIPETDFTGAWAVEVDVRGDGQGGRLDMQLGRRGPERSVYYRNDRDSYDLDFTGWRRLSFQLIHFHGPPGRPHMDDLSKVFFVQLFISGRDRVGTTQIAFDNIRAVPATPQQAETLARYAQEARKMEGEPALDGSNLLPNPSFEMDLGDPGKPAFWQPGGTESEGYPVPFSRAPDDTVTHAYETDLARTGERSVSVHCSASEAKGAWLTSVPLAPGPWTLEAWCRTEGMQSEPRHGPVARVTTRDAAGRVILHFHAYGAPSEDDWTPVRMWFDAPPETVSAEVQLRNDWATGTVWWDDVHLGADLDRRAQLEAQREEDLRLLPEMREMLEQARGQVALLKEQEQTPELLLLGGVLEWALQDAQLALDAQMGRDARATLRDVLDYCARAGEILAAAREARVALPPRPAPDGNPYVERLNEQMPGLAGQTRLYPRGWEAYREIEGSWHFRTLGANAATMAWGLLDPRSDLRDDPRLLAHTLAHIQAILDNHIAGSVTPFRDSRDWNIDRFALSPMMDALLMVYEAYPWAILPSKREAWWRETQTMVEYQAATYGCRHYEHSPRRPQIYPNMDVHYMLIMEFARRMFDDERYAVERDRFLHFMDEGLHPMGAWTYTGMQNEVYGYHQLNTTFMARYYELTGDERARDILRRSLPYYPLVHDTEGMTEHYTDVAWKHNWGAASPAGADTKAGMFDCAENKRAALDAARRGGYPGGLTGIYAAPWWKDLPPAQRPQTGLVCDENIQGPRGWNGRFSYAGSTRTTRPGAIGRATFVGCMIGDREAQPRPLDAAFQMATIEFRIRPEGDRWADSRFHSGHERPSVIVTPDFSTLAVHYRVTRGAWGGNSADEPWEGAQQWFLSGNRLIGLLTIRPLEDTSAAGVWGRLHFGMDREFEQGQEGMFRYGSLITRLHAHNFAGVELGRPETVIGGGVSDRSRQIILKDARARSGQEPPFEYRAGEEFHYLAEVLPYWNDLAGDVARISAPRVRGLAFTEGATRYFLLHNETAQEAVCSYKAQGRNARLFRPPDRSEPLQLTDGAFSVTIPAHSHVVVVVEQ